MTSNRLRALVGASIVLPLCAVTAWAAPDRATDLSIAAPEFSWDGGPLTGAILGIDSDRDDTHVKLAGDGGLTIKLTDFQDDTGAPDFDIRLYAADPAGDPTGEALGEAIEADNESETLTVKNLKAGGYVIEVNAFLTVNGTFKGKVTFAGTGGAAPAPTAAPGSSPTPAPVGNPRPTPAPGVDQRPDAKFGKIARKPKSLSGTATDDKGVKRVEVAVQLKKGAKCTQLNRKKKFVRQTKCDAPTKWLAAKGTTKWSFKLPKLRKGAYTFFARAIDSAGQVQAGFTPANKRSVKVR